MDVSARNTTDALIQRLNDLVFKLSLASSMAADAVHSELDKIDRIIREDERQHDHTSHQSPRITASRREDVYEGPPTPTQTKMRLPHLLPRFGRREDEDESQSVRAKTAERIRVTEEARNSDKAKAAEIAKAAEDFAAKMSETLAALLKRKEESDVIHDLLLTRAERAAERIAELEDDIEGNQSELEYLRIQLKAIEAQCGLPRNDDPELTQAINNWKMDWEAIGKRSNARGTKIRVSLS